MDMSLIAKPVLQSKQAEGDESMLLTHTDAHTCDEYPSEWQRNTIARCAQWPPALWHTTSKNLVHSCVGSRQWLLLYTR